MKLLWYLFRVSTSFLPGVMFLLPLPLASAETLADIDQEIQSNKTIKSDRDGLDAFNIYEGVTDSRLDRKVKILQNAGINPRFYQTGSGVTDYTNFYSFTSLVGVTDTKLDIVSPNATFRLYRRGNSGYKEALGYLGSWWGDQYRGIQASRDEQAILAAWGSDLQRIYVIDMPPGYTLVGGIAAPMEKNGEYRSGGAYQYYYRGALTSWLVYALYAPDYLKSYSGAVTSAQKAGRSIATDLGWHLDQTRHAAGNLHDSGAGEAGNPEGELWLRVFGGNLDYEEVDGSSVNSQTGGMSIGWQRMINGQQSADQSRGYWGVMFGLGVNLQKYGISDVENKSKATVGGVYGLYMQSSDSPRSWYGSGSILFGGLDFENTVPGELGYGLNQDYDGNITAVTVENGISFRQNNSWAIEPQLQLSYLRIGQSDFNDNLGARVSLNQGESFQGRLGIAVRKTLSSAQDRQSSIWAKLGYICDFSNPNEVSVAGDLAISELNQNSYVLTVGADYKLSKSLNLQGQVEEVFDGEKGFQGNLALKYTW
ncbi:MAG: autotransporter outer membrane beta-barrel domain-containing protein [Proteobacteria bacterium]|nr:autotransporter outer membrane beta-barrel domain-containing protein [Pseudomonadota bacterium]MBU1420605.1 autotransporter outer membrane beta-barrel domain-containing protein [Pseudomonadota bacterium]MBU1455788.1 autotransporter outer membrane beta-barrel domain-containing protein [Pseudomonadota bacterium]